MMMRISPEARAGPDDEGAVISNAAYTTTATAKTMEPTSKAVQRGPLFTH